MSNEPKVHHHRNRLESFKGRNCTFWWTCSGFNLESSHPAKWDTRMLSPSSCSHCTLQPRPPGLSDHLGRAEPSGRDSFFFLIRYKVETTSFPSPPLPHPSVSKSTTFWNKAQQVSSTSCRQELHTNDISAEQAWGRAAGWDLNHHSDFCFCEIIPSTFHTACKVQPIHELRAVYTVLGKQY